MSGSTLRIDDFDLYYEESGSGPPVLLIHGAGAYAGLWDPCREELSKTHHVIAYDRRGCSRSAHDPVRDIMLHVSDAQRLIQERFDQKPVIVGWSAGAAVALHLAIAHPESVAALVLAEPSFPLKAPQPLALGAMIRWELTKTLRGNVAGAETFYRWVSQYRRGGNAFDQYPEQWRTEMLANHPALFAEVRLGGGAQCEQLRRAQLESIAMPIDILVGDQSASIFEPSARYLARVAKHAKIVTLPGVSHMIPSDSPNEVAAAARDIV